MKLTGMQLRRLQTALLSAFPFRGELERLLRFEMDKLLDEIVSSHNLSQDVFELILWAEAQGRLEELIQAAYRANPSNRELSEFIKQYENEKVGAEPDFKQINRKA
jgi:hypothetical protein